MSRGQQSEPNARTRVATGSHKEIERERHKNDEVSSLHSNRMKSNCTTQQFYKACVIS